MSSHETQGPTAAPASSVRPNPFPNLRQRRRRTLRLTTAATMALGLAVSGGAVAGAATSGTAPSTASTPGAPSGGPGGTPPVAMGTVASVGTDTFTLTTRNGTVTVDVGSGTTYFDQGVSSPGFADVVVGAHVAVFGTESSDTVTATKVAVGGPNDPGGRGGPGGPGGPGGTPPVAMGTVASVGTDTFTLTTRNGTVTVDVGSGTTYFDQGVSSPGFADVVVGAHVAVFGTESSDTVTATKVAVGGPNGPTGSGGTPPTPRGGDTGPNGWPGRPPAPTAGSTSGSASGTSTAA